MGRAVDSADLIYVVPITGQCSSCRARMTCSPLRQQFTALAARGASRPSSTNACVRRWCTPPCGGAGPLLRHRRIHSPRPWWQVRRQDGRAAAALPDGVFGARGFQQSPPGSSPCGLLVLVRVPPDLYTLLDRHFGQRLRFRRLSAAARTGPPRPGFRVEPELAGAPIQALHDPGNRSANGRPLDIGRRILQAELGRELR